MVTWFKQTVATRSFIYSLVSTLVLSFIWSAFLMFPHDAARAAADQIIQFTPIISAQKNQNLKFEVSVNQQVDSVVLHFRKLSSIDPFRDVTFQTEDQHKYTCTLNLVESNFTWEKIEYYIAAYREARRIDKTDTYVVNFIDKPQISELTLLKSKALSKKQFDELTRMPIYKKWWFWVPVTVAVGVGVWLATDSGGEKAKENVELTQISITPLFSQSSARAKCEVVAGVADCHNILIYPLIPCEILKIKYEVDITKGTPPYTVKWEIERWKEGQLPVELLTFPDAVTTTTHLTSEEIEYCVLYEQLFTPLNIRVTVTDKNMKTATVSTNVTFKYWNE